MRITEKLVLIFFAVLFKESSSVCLDKFALSSVDALVHKQKNSRAIVHRRENFNTLDNYMAIDVIGSNVSELCEGKLTVLYKNIFLFLAINQGEIDFIPLKYYFVVCT